MKNSLIGGIVAASLLVSSAFAAEKAPLAAGKPAGTKEAAFLGVYAPVIIAAGLGLFVALAASGTFNDDKKSSTGTGAR